MATLTLNMFHDLVWVILCSVYYYLECLLKTLTPHSCRDKADFAEKIVLITGGAGGIAKFLALKLAGCRATVVLWDINQKALAHTKHFLNSKGYQNIHVYTVDISEKQQVYKHAKLLMDDVGPVDILINNAATVYGDLLLNLPDDEIEKTFKVNVMSHYWTTKAFLPSMMSARSGHIVTIGSLAGLLGVYKCTDYSATKFATVGFHESLYIELMMCYFPVTSSMFKLIRLRERPHCHIFMLRSVEGVHLVIALFLSNKLTQGYDEIKMTLVCPYIIDTDLFRGAQSRIMPILEPEYVADKIVRSIELQEHVCLIPNISRFLTPLKYVMPAKLCWELMYRLVQGPQSMQSVHFRRK